MRRLHAALASALFSLVGCGGAESALRPEPLSVSAYGSSSSASTPGSSFQPRGPSTSAAGEEGAGIVVAPTMLEVPFALSVKGEGADAVNALEVESKALGAALGAATGRATHMRMRVLRKELRSDGKLANAEKHTVVEGCAEIDVSKDGDFWARARVLAAIETVAPADHVRVKEELRATFAAPVPRVRDVESHRAELVERWVARSRAFIAATEKDGAGKLHVSDCAPPLLIRQSPVAVDRVALTLDVTCKLASDAPR